MFIDLKDYEEWDNVVNNQLFGQFVSPGYLCNKYGLSRQIVHNWINRDNLMNAYRYEGKQGYYIAIPMKQVEIIYDTKIKSILKNRQKEKK